MRRFSVIVAAVLSVLGASTDSAAAAPSVVGSWHGALTMNGQRCTVAAVLNANRSYIESVRCGSLMTQQSGTYRVFANGEIGFSVIDWQPKQQWVVGAQVGSGHYAPMAKPPGGLFKYTFVSATTMIWRDVNFGGSIALQRL